MHTYPIIGITLPSDSFYVWLRPDWKNGNGAKYLKYYLKV